MSEATPERPPLLLGLRSRFRLSLAATMAVRTGAAQPQPQPRTHARRFAHPRKHADNATQRRTSLSPLRQAFPALRRLQDIWNQARAAMRTHALARAPQALTQRKHTRAFRSLSLTCRVVLCLSPRRPWACLHPKRRSSCWASAMTSRRRSARMTTKPPPPPSHKRHAKHTHTFACSVFLSQRTAFRPLRLR
jgi:hypothetical protein